MRKYWTLRLTQLLVFLPTSALAHGEQVLIPFTIDFVNLIILVVVLILSKFTLRGKLILATIYLTMMVAVNYWCFETETYLEFINNMAPTNIAILLAPVTALIVSYLIIRKWFTRIDG